ncbi:MAG: hypothetical protein IPJ62_20915 [Betaproteobacteria bacterium]|nr:hypothetical protein [Betaproteobacteria bacterium]
MFDPLGDPIRAVPGLVASGRGPKLASHDSNVRLLIEITAPADFPGLRRRFRQGVAAPLPAPPAPGPPRNGGGVRRKTCVSSTKCFSFKALKYAFCTTATLSFHRRSFLEIETSSRVHPENNLYLRKISNGNWNREVV